MSQINWFTLFCGMVMGYALWNIIDIIRMNNKVKKIDDVIEQMKQDLNKSIPRVLKQDMDKEHNPLIAAHDTLKQLGMPESKLYLNENKTSLLVLYGVSCAVVIDRQQDGAVISIGLIIQKDTNQLADEKDKEVAALKQLLLDCKFDEKMFEKSLAKLVVRLYEEDKTKYYNVTRLIPRDML